MSALSAWPDRRAAHALRRAGRALARVAGLAAVALLLSGHIGSPDTWFEGRAGPYPVRVVVRLPGVVPGLAQIDITTAADGIERVTAQPVIYDAGSGGAPPPDVAKPVPGRPGTYHAELWFMTPGSFSVNVEVSGAEGVGSVAVPVAAVAVRQIGLYPWLSKLLLGLGALLFVGAVTIVRAAATDAVVEPGERAPRGLWRGRIAAAVGVVTLGLALWGGRLWGNAVEGAYERELYRPFAADASVLAGQAGRALSFSITDSTWRTRRVRYRWERFSVSPLVPDHGKLMHMFLIRSDGNAFAHLHPVSVDSQEFVTGLGGLPAGRYDVYADVVHETGFPQTLVATVEVPAGAGDLGDPDDAIFEGAPAGDLATLADGSTLTWERGPGGIVAGEAAGLRFVLRDSTGQVAPVEPYLGMAGHAVVRREDGQVYVHLHPSGTISAAAQAALLARQSGAADAAPMSHPMSFDGRVSFPYAFPSAGSYRVWVQLKHQGRILTATYAAHVD